MGGKMGGGDGGAGALPAGPDGQGELRQRAEPGRMGCWVGASVSGQDPAASQGGDRALL